MLTCRRCNLVYSNINTYKAFFDICPACVQREAVENQTQSLAEMQRQRERQDAARTHQILSAIQQESHAQNQKFEVLHDQLSRMQHTQQMVFEQSVTVDAAYKLGQDLLLDPSSDLQLYYNVADGSYGLSLRENRFVSRHLSDAVYRGAFDRLRNEHPVNITREQLLDACYQAGQANNTCWPYIRFHAFMVKINVNLCNITWNLNEKTGFRSYNVHSNNTQDQELLDAYLRGLNEYVKKQNTPELCRQRKYKREPFFSPLLEYYEEPLGAALTVASWVIGIWFLGFLVWSSS